jgi:hypothetical protein
MAFSGNGRDFAFIPQAEEPSFLYALNTETLENTGASPFPLPTNRINAFGKGPVTGRYFIGDMTQVHVLAADTFEPVAGSPIDGYASVIFISPNEQNIYIYRSQGFLSTYDPDDLKMTQNLYLPLQGLEYGYIYPNIITPDNSMVFIAGSTLDTNQPVIQAIYADDMSVATWSPWEGQNKTVLDMKITPNGSRFFVLTTDGYVYVIDPSF